MSTITNQLKHRAVKVRNGKGVVVTIAPGASERVDGFDPNRKFNAALLDQGDIRVGGSTKRRDDTDRQEQLQADLEAAQTAFKQAKDSLSAANKALKEDETDANKKAKSLAVENFKATEAELDRAQKAFAKG